MIERGPFQCSVLLGAPVVSRTAYLEDDTHVGEREKVVCIEPTPGALRGLQQLERHRQCCGSRASPLGHSCVEIHRGEGGLNLVGDTSSARPGSRSESEVGKHR